MDQKRLSKLLKASGDTVRPSRIFAFKMRWRLMKKGWLMFWDRTKFGFKFATAFGLVALMAGSGVGTYAYTSPEVNAASPLYPIKQGIESIEVGFAFTPDQKAEAHMKMAMRRVAEAESLQRRIEGAGERDQEALEQTLEMMEDKLDASLQTAEAEHDTEVARKILEDFEKNCQQMHNRVIKLDASERAGMTAEMAQDRLQRIKRMRQDMELLDPRAVPRFQLHDLRPPRGDAFMPPPMPLRLGQAAP